MADNRPLLLRFFSKIDEDANGCWIWEGARNSNGYGVIRNAGRQLLAHRVSYALFVGPIPSGKFCLHLCHVEECVNYQHLKLGSQGENIKHQYARGKRPEELRIRLPNGQFAPKSRRTKNGNAARGSGRANGGNNTGEETWPQ